MFESKLADKGARVGESSDELYRIVWLSVVPQKGASPRSLA